MRSDAIGLNVAIGTWEFDEGKVGRDRVCSYTIDSGVTAEDNLYCAPLRISSHPQPEYPYPDLFDLKANQR